MVASYDAEKAMGIVVKFLEQTPGCSRDDTMAAYKVRYNWPDTNELFLNRAIDDAASVLIYGSC